MMDMERGYYALGYMDSLAYGESFIHRLDARAKIIATLAFVIVTVSYQKYEVASLLPLAFYPVLLIAASGVPARYIARKLIFLSPFALMIGLFNPLLDREPMLGAFGFAISGGWISFASIMLKFALTASAALLLISTTSFPAIGEAMVRLRVPRLFVTQLMFVYRYIFVLIEEAMRMARARRLRSFRGERLTMAQFTELAGVLFIRTYERAERVYQAMLARNYSGTMSTLGSVSMRPADWAFLVLVLAALAMIRFYGLTARIGGAIL